eukprot:7325571-Alexandrium_andersonii.AAC.1
MTGNRPRSRGPTRKRPDLTGHWQQEEALNVVCSVGHWQQEETLNFVCSVGHVINCLGVGM